MGRCKSNYHTIMTAPLYIGYGIKRHFQQYFSYIVVVNFIGGRNQSTRRKPQTYRKSLTNFITYWTKWNVIEMVAWKKISRNDSWTGFLICHNKFTKFTIFFATYWLLPTWWALHIRSKSCLFKNLLTTSPPNVNDTPLSFSPHPCTSLSGSDHNKSHNKPAIH